MINHSLRLGFLTSGTAAFLALLMSGPAHAAQSKTAVDLGGCHYDIHISDQPVKTIDVRFRCAGDAARKMAGHRLIPHDHVRRVRPGVGSLLAKAEYSWTFSGSGGVTRGAYTFDMEDLTQSTNAMSIARRRGPGLITSISSILLYPAGPSTPLSIRFTLSKAAVAMGGKVATAFRRTGSGSEEIQWLKSSDIADAGMMVLGRFARRDIMAPGRGSLAAKGESPPYREAAATITLAIVAPGLKGDPKVFDQWVRESAKQVARYFRGFPARRSMILVMPVAGRTGVFRGRVVSGGGPTVILTVGGTIDRRRLYNDWILVHELIHIGSPYLRRAGRWLNEGTAVYLQSIVHVRAGWLTAARVWRGFMRQMPMGLNTVQGNGLRSARGIGGVYWGGSLFMLLADIDIRHRTGGKKSLGDCLRAVLWQGGDSSQVWTPGSMMAACDKAVGTDTMSRLAARYVSRGTEVDLGKLWRDMGLIRDENGFRFDDKAPLAAIRKAIMTGRAK